MNYTLPVLNTKRPADCRGCDLDLLSTGFVQPEGTCANGVLFVGESAGTHEAREGLPFRPQAPAGSVLARVMRELGIDRRQFGIHNICSCQPPKNELLNQWYEVSASRHCRVHFRRAMERFKPRVIVALGNVALKSLTGMWGDKQTIDHLRGYRLDCPEFPGVHVVPTYHPSFIVRGAWNVYSAFKRDIQFALQIARDGWKEPVLEYNERANEGDLIELRNTLEANPEMVLSVDFETDGQENVDEDAQLMKAIEDLYSENSKKRKVKKAKLGTSQEITQVNFSIAPGSALVTDNIGTRGQLAAQIIALPNPKIGHNVWCFDQPEAAINGIEWNGETDDTMQMFHHLYPDLPGKRGKMNGELDGSFANLQYCSSFAGFPFPWKHEVKQRPEFYGCCDADSALRLFFTIRAAMQALKSRNGTSVWEGYCKLVYNVQPILTAMQSRGIPVNKPKMLEFLKMVIREQKIVSDQLQSHVPDDLRPYKPKEGYKKVPKSLEGCMVREFLLPESDERCKCNKIRKKDLEMWAEVPGAKWELVKIKDPNGPQRLRAPNPECIECGGAGWIQWDAGVVQRYVKLAPFNPSSPPQMKQYCRVKHYSIPKNSKGKFAMDKETLAKLAKKTQDAVFKLAISYREYDKMAGTYALGWMPESDGCVHTQFTFFPATGQLSSVSPNCQNVPNASKFGKLAEGFRDAIQASSDRLLVELDKKSYHAQTLGFEAGCPEYIRLAKIDIHSYLACCMEKVPEYQYALEWSDDELRAWLKWYRKNYTLKDGTPFETLRNGRAKPGILGYGFGLGGNKLYLLNEDSFTGPKEAQYVLDTLDATFPKVKQFRDTIPLVAKRQGGKLISNYGSIRWFWDIGYPKQGGEFEHGKDWEAAIAYLPATDAFGDMKHIMFELEQAGCNEKYGLINQVHDSLLYHPHKSELEEMLAVVPKMMQRPSKVMLFEDGTGLDVGVEAKMGKTWRDMKEVAI